jgi:SAM-dependent methyltransferase
VSAQTHTADPRILNRRTLERDHRRLAALLRPGTRVLDVGCGTGAITTGIAGAVGPEGATLGIDRDAALVAMAREQYGDVPGLAFEKGDVFTLPASADFDVVNAARTLQWVDRPAVALARMAGAARRGGLVVALDYSHARLAWEPTPPPEVLRFYQAFLAWREANGWDNLMADHLPQLFVAARLSGISVSVEDEVARAGQEEFDPALALWEHVIESAGPTIVAAGFLADEERTAAAAAYAAWRAHEARALHMVLRTVSGRR